MYRKYKILRKYVNGNPTDEIKSSGVLYDNFNYSSYEDCLSGGGEYFGEDIKNHPYYGECFTIEVLEDGIFSFSVNGNHYYNKNDEGWFVLENELSLKVGDKVKLKRKTDYDGNLTPPGASYSSTIKTMPTSNIYGNFNSLYAGDDFETSFNISKQKFSSFFYKTNIVDASNLVLPYLNLTDYLYQFMFRDCTKLTKAPVLPATELTEGSYYYMFYGCSALETAPVLPAPTLIRYCYYSMFQNCSSLNYIKCLATDIAHTKASLNYWVDNVAPTGTFVKKKGVEYSGVTGGLSWSDYPIGWTVEEVD